MLEVGFSSAVISPQLPVTLAGFGARKGEVTEIRDDLEAQVVVLRDGELTLCLVVLDLLMLGPDFAEPLRQRVAAALKTPVAEVLTSCTHTHSGPAGTKDSKRAGWPVQDGYFELLATACTSAAMQAAKLAQPAQLSFATGDLPDGLSLNRRGHAYAPTFSVLDVTTTAGRRIGSIANVAIHPVAAGDAARAVSRDWPGAFRDAASASTGAPCVLLSGAIGDVNPAVDPHDAPEKGGKWESMTQLGVDVAAAVVTLLEKAAPIEPTIKTAANRIRNIRAGLTLPAMLSHNLKKKVPVEFVEWELGGDVRLVSLPGEAFHKLGVEVAAARNNRVLMAAIAPHWCGYLPCPYTRGYEEVMSFGKRFTAAVREVLIDRPSLDN